MSKLTVALPRYGLEPSLVQWATILEEDFPVRSETAAYTATSIDFLILCDATSAAFSVTLPAAADNKGKLLAIKKTDASVNAVTIDGNASETIDGATTVSLGSQYSSRLLMSDGLSNWAVLASV